METSTENGLYVFWNSEPVGRIFEGESGDLSFQYEQKWVHENRPAVSISMPVTDKRYHKEAHYFFGNLLPEGDLRRKIEAVAKTSADNDYRLLSRLGGDCAGALSIGAYLQNDESAYYQEPTADHLRKSLPPKELQGLCKVATRPIVFR